MKTFIDKRYFDLSDSFLAGTDEVGRGPLAGPVVAATVLCPYVDLLSFDNLIKELGKLSITDSKKLSEKKRKDILKQLKINENLKKGVGCITLNSGSLLYSIASVSPLQIDKINILKASLLSMQKSLDLILSDFKFQGPKMLSGKILIDGQFSFKTGDSILGIPIVKGDQKSVLIALASILAKNYRDDLMKEMGLLYPAFNFEQNAGYPTKEHCLNLKKFGPTPIHRKTFGPVKKFYEEK